VVARFGGQTQGSAPYIDDRPLKRTAADIQFVIETDDAARFRALAIDVNFAAGDGFGSERSGLKKTRRPKPFVDSALFIICVVVHDSLLFTAKKSAAAELHLKAYGR
jgi:hypothetical protein